MREGGGGWRGGSSGGRRWEGRWQQGRRPPLSQIQWEGRRQQRCAVAGYRPPPPPGFGGGTLVDISPFLVFLVFLNVLVSLDWSG